MADDTLQTHTIDPLEARVVLFRQQPDARGFAELCQELRDTGRGELLADMCTTWAPHERDPIRAADAWSEAGEAMVIPDGGSPRPTPAWRSRCCHRRPAATCWRSSIG